MNSDQMVNGQGSRIALFVSPHGLGHAARISAVAEALQTLRPSIRFEIFTQVPIWFFEQSLTLGFGYNEIPTDIGLVQETAFAENVPETIKLLDSFLPFDERLIESLAKRLAEQQFELVVCDIAPLGIVAARAAGIPSVLIENFTWAWVYEKYARHREEFMKHSEYMDAVFEAADYRVRAEPTCGDGNADLVVRPIARTCRLPRSEVRSKLGIPDDHKAVMVTTGGVPSHISRRSIRGVPSDTHIIIPSHDQSLRRQDNVVLLPMQSGVYHPDLVNACDAIVGKLGYSTVPEAYYSRIRFGYVRHDSFPESDILERFVTNHMSVLEVPQLNLESGDWISCVDRLGDLPESPIVNHTNGSQRAARFILSLLS
jgi:hypothetical protein